MTGARYRTSGRLLVASLALMIASGGIALAIFVFRPGGRPVGGQVLLPLAHGDGVGFSPSEHPRIAAKVPLPHDGTGGGLAVGAGSVWVGLASDQGHGQSSVIRIDLATNDVIAEIPVVGTPYRNQIAATDEAVWAGSGDLVERIDPDTNEVTASIQVPRGTVSVLAADDTTLWVVAIRDRSDEGLQNTGSLVRIDPATNDVVAEIPLGSEVTGYGDEIRLGAGSVWVLGTRLEGEDAEYGGDLIRVDPMTNSIVARISVGGFHMVVTQDYVWVLFPADGVSDQVYATDPPERWLWTRVDVETNKPSESFEFAGHGLKLVSPQALWAVDYDGQENVRVTRYDPETLRMEEQSEPIESLFHDSVLDATSRTVWISAVWTVVRVDID